MKSRQQRILDILTRKKYVSVLKLVQELHYSESTIRRDLSNLEKLKLIKRTPGGAVLIKEESVENPDSLKSRINREEKRLISELALDFVEDYQTIFLDSSSTCQIFAEQLVRRKNLTILTTNLSTALTLDMSKKHQVYSVGGLVKDGKVGGSLTEQLLSQVQIDTAFISCRGFDLDFGASDVWETEAAIKKLVRTHARQAILLADYSKFAKKFMFQSLTRKQFDAIITDSAPPSEIKAYLEAEEVETIYWND